MKRNSQHQRELYFSHAHDAPPVIDYGNCYSVKDIEKKMLEYGHTKREIQKVIVSGLAFVVSYN